MDNFFTLDNVLSSEFNLYISGNGVFNAPEPDIEQISVPGRNGDLIISNNRYKNINVTYPAFVIDSLAENVDSIKAWLLSNVGYRKLEDTYNPKYFRMGRAVGSLEVESIVQKMGVFEIAFDCKPQRFLKQGQEKIVLDKASKIINPELFPALPYMKVYGTGDVNLIINSQIIKIKNIDKFIELDFDTQNAFKGTINKNDLIYSADFKPLEKGVTDISWVGSVSHIEIIPKWWTL